MRAECLVKRHDYANSASFVLITDDNIGIDNNFQPTCKRPIIIFLTTDKHVFERICNNSREVFNTALRFLVVGVDLLRSKLCEMEKGFIFNGFLYSKVNYSLLRSLHERHLQLYFNNRLKLHKASIHH